MNKNFDRPTVISKKWNETKERNLDARLRQQAALASFGEYAVQCKNIDELLNEGILLVTKTLDTEFCKVLELLPDGKEFIVKAAVGWEPGQIGSATISADPHTQAGYALNFKKPVIADDYQTENRFSGPSLLSKERVSSGMSVILPGLEQPYGVISTHSVQPKKFNKEDTKFLASVANILASAIVRFRTEEELRRSRDELAIILGGISEGVTAQDPTGRIIYANPAGAEIIGFRSPADLLSAPVGQILRKFEVYDEEGRPVSPGQLPGRLVFDGAEMASARLRFINLETGEERWSIVKARSVFNPEGKVVLSVNIFRDITELVRRDQAQKLLMKAGSILASSLDYEQTLANIAQLMVTDLSDWCTIHLVQEGQLGGYQVAVAHKDPGMVSKALEFQQRYPTDWQAGTGLPRVMRTGQAEYYPEVTGEMLRQSARSEEHYRVLTELGMHSVMMVPLIARGRTLGAITLIWAESGRTYSTNEVELVEELARRAALAIDNARLYRESQDLNEKLERRVEQRTRQLETSNKQLLIEVEERRRAETALRKSESLLHSLFESAPDATVLIDPFGKITQVNRKTESLFGYSRDELVGRQVSYLVNPTAIDRSCRDQQLRNKLSCLIEAIGEGSEIKGRRKDRSFFPVDITLNPIENEDGELIICAIRDITESRRLQTELAETHRRLFESVEAERRMLSQELHDGPLQDLYGVSLSLQALEDAVTGESVEDLDTSKDTINSVMQTLRGICGELRPPTLVQLGLGKAIRSHLMKVKEAHPALRINADLAGDGQILSERARLALYRVYQNSMINILRHAQATEVSVSLNIDSDQVVLQIQDNGLGFKIPNKWVDLVRAGHFGLVGMSERVEAIGGNFTVISAPGQGTRVEVTVPLNNVAL